MMSDNKQTIRDFGRYAQIVFVRAYEAQNGETRWPKTGDTVELYGKTDAFKFVPKRLKSGKTGVKPLACKVDHQQMVFTSSLSPRTSQSQPQRRTPFRSNAISCPSAIGWGAPF